MRQEARSACSAAATCSGVRESTADSGATKKGTNVQTGIGGMSASAMLSRASGSGTGSTDAGAVACIRAIVSRKRRRPVSKRSCNRPGMVPLRKRRRSLSILMMAIDGFLMKKSRLNGRQLGEQGCQKPPLPMFVRRHAEADHLGGDGIIAQLGQAAALAEIQGMAARIIDGRTLAALASGTVAAMSSSDDWPCCPGDRRPQARPTVRLATVELLRHTEMVLHAQLISGLSEGNSRLAAGRSCVGDGNGRPVSDPDPVQFARSPLACPAALARRAQPLCHVLACRSLSRRKPSDRLAASQPSSAHADAFELDDADPPHEHSLAAPAPDGADVYRPTKACWREHTCGLRQREQSLLRQIMFRADWQRCFRTCVVHGSHSIKGDGRAVKTKSAARPSPECAADAKMTVVQLVSFSLSPCPERR